MSYEKVKFGIDVLDEVLPDGVPRTSFIVLAGSGGTGKTILTLLIAKQFLLRKEPVIYVALDDDPNSVVSILQSLGVEVYTYVTERLLIVIDGFSFRIKDRKEKTSIWVVGEVDPMNPEQVLYTITQLIDKLEIRNRGIVIVDSLNEFLSYHGNLKVSEFVKNLRANVSKYRGIITISVLHTSLSKAKRFLALIEHVVDGIIYTDQQPKDTEVLRYISVKRMRGVRHKVDKVAFIINQNTISKAA